MDSRLHELLDVWEERQAAGRSLSAEELCALRPEWAQESPQLLGELRETIRRLNVFERQILNPELPSTAATTSVDAFPVIEGYRVERLVGRGGMGRVFLARDVELGLPVAIKVLELRSPTLLDSDQKVLARRFVQEAQTLAGLTHPHIVRVFAGRPRDDCPYFAMEYLPRSLAEPSEQALLRRAGPRAITQLLSKVASAVHFAHTQGVLHRDLKPANILLDSNGEPKVCDFGLAKVAPSVEEAPVEGQPALEDDTVQDTFGQLTRGDRQPGTPCYMAPEQADPSRGAVSPATDAWALGVVLFELLAGHRPFSASNRVPLSRQICHDEAPALPGADRRLAHLVRRCLHKHPSQRPAVAELAKSLQRFRPRNWRLRLGAAALLLLALASLALGLHAVQPEQRYRRAVAPLVAELGRGNTVDLLTTPHVPPCILREDAGGTRIWRTDEGLHLFTTSFAILEFLPGIPTSSFTILIEMQHAMSGTSDGYCGWYYGGSHTNTSAGMVHALPIFAFNDVNQGKVPVDPWNRKAGAKLVNSAWFHVNFLRIEGGEGRQSPISSYHHATAKLGERIKHYYQARDMIDDFRVLEFEVRDEAIKPIWTDRPKDRPPERIEYSILNVPVIQRELARMATQPTAKGGRPEYAEITFDPRSHNATGLVVYNGKCTVRRILVIPTP